MHSDLHNYQGVERKSSIAKDTFPVETNIHCRVLCHLMNRRVLGRMDNGPQQHSEHHLVQTPYTDSDNDMSRRYKDPSLVKKCEMKKRKWSLRIKAIKHRSNKLAFWGCFKLSVQISYT